jgi:hypothetical protein
MQAKSRDWPQLVIAMAAFVVYLAARVGYFFGRMGRMPALYGS